MAWYNFFRKSSKPKQLGEESLDRIEEFPLYKPAEAKAMQEAEKKHSFLETLTEEEIHTLKDAMMVSRANYLTAIRIIAKDQNKNPVYMLEQQGLLEDVLRRYAKGDGIAGIADDYQLQPGKLREFLEPLGFTEEEFPYHDKD
ncbi:MAG: hypothetical protein V1645_02430 [archaeon]